MLESAIRGLSRNELADLCEQLIDRLDLMDPDPDLEWNGDELDGNNSEEDHGVCGTGRSGLWGHAGCPIADPDEAVDDRGCDGDTDREPDDDYERWLQPVALN